jgi:hypothetical protein
MIWFCWKIIFKFNTKNYNIDFAKLLWKRLKCFMMRYRHWSYWFQSNKFIHPYSSVILSFNSLTLDLGLSILWVPMVIQVKKDPIQLCSNSNPNVTISKLLQYLLPISLHLILYEQYSCKLFWNILWFKHM